MKTRRFNTSTLLVVFALIALLTLGKAQLASAQSQSGNRLTKTLPNTLTAVWTFAASLNQARTYNTMTLLLNGKILVTGGNSTNAQASQLASAELYDPVPDTWSLVPDMSSPRNGHTATLLPDGKVLVVGGASGYTALASVELYDPGTNSWSPAADLNTPRWAHTATLLDNGKVLVTGGINNYGNTVLDSAEVYDPATNTWQVTSSMNIARVTHVATLLEDGKVLVTGGGSDTSSYTALSSTELYDPATGAWAPAASMSDGHRAHTATLLDDGKVLVVGGEDTGFTVHGAELYDPATNSWSLAGTMNSTRTRHTATLLDNGTVLVTGGIHPPSDISSSEVYDPSTNTWSLTQSLNVARDSHGAALMGDGRVLVAGGWDGSSALNSAELYTMVVTPDNTPPGTNVTVSPISGTTVTFSNVSTGGSTDVTTSSSGPTPPAGFSLGDPPTFYNISTTATFTPPVTTCIAYDPSQFSDLNPARLLHYEDPTWLDVTTSNDTTNHVVCGQTNSLSPFVVAKKKFTFLGFYQPIDNLPTINVAKAGQAIPIKWSLKDANGSYVSNLATTVSYGYGTVTCGSGTTDTIEQYVNAGSTSLRYDSSTNQFVLTSKTDKAWVGTCKTFTLVLSDGTKHQANFKFTK